MPEQAMRQVLAELTILSEVPSAFQVGGRIQNGMPDRTPRGPNESTADEFRRRFNSALGPTSRQLVLDEARLALERARRASAPREQPSKDDPQWKRWVAESSQDGGELARLFGVTRQYIHQVRRQYRDAA